MMTLTYPAHFPSDGQLCKRHLRALLQQLRRKKIIDYLWFFEFQRRGAPHIHIMLPVLVRRHSQQLWLSRAWYRIVDSGDRKHLAAGTNWENFRLRDGAKRYALKEMAKMWQKRVPSGFCNVGRFWGHSKGVRPVPVEILPCSQTQLEQAIEESALLYKNKYNLADLRVIFGAGDLHIPLIENNANDL
jgi:hypothetical protein